MPTDTQVQFDVFRVDVHNECVWREEQMLKLTPKAFAVLRHFLERPGRVLSRNDLLEHVWGDAVYVTDRTVEEVSNKIMESTPEKAIDPTDVIF